MAEFTVSEVILASRSLGAGRDGDTFKVNRIFHNCICFRHGIAYRSYPK